MKRIIFNTGIFLLFIFLANPMMAVNKPLKEATATASSLKKDMTAKEVKKLEKFEKKLDKRMAKMNEKLSKNNDIEIDFQDPIDKWLWFAVAGLAGVLAFALMATLVLPSFFSFLASASALFFLITLVIWLVKKFG